MRDIAADLMRRSELVGDLPLVIDGSGHHTLTALLQRARDLAELIERVCGREPTILVQADNTWRTVVSAVAAGRVDGTVAVISRHSTRQEFEGAREDLRPDAILTSPESAGVWHIDGPQTQRLDALDGWVGVLQPVGEGAQRWGGGSVIGLTSGSTGRPKGVVHSEQALRYAASATIETIGLRSGDRVAGMVPLSSTAALCFGMYLPLLLGGTAVLTDSWDPSAALAILADYDVRWTMCVPTMALQLATAAEEVAAPRSLTAMTVGGGPMNAAALERAEQQLNTRILRVFGMSECLGHTTPDLDDEPEIRLGRDGRPFTGTELRVVDENDAPVPSQTTGQAQVRGPSLFLGYALDGRLTSPQLTAGGFLPTGDFAKLHSDGTISILGRAKDVIIRGGRNIEVAEVESAIASHPAVDQLCVVPIPDDILGERVAALVVAVGADVDLAVITNHLADCGVSKTKWPEAVFQVSSLPQNRVGKLSRIEATHLAEKLHAAR